MIDDHSPRHPPKIPGILNVSARPKETLEPICDSKRKRSTLEGLVLVHIERVGVRFRGDPLDFERSRVLQRLVSLEWGNNPEVVKVTYYRSLPDWLFHQNLSL